MVHPATSGLIALGFVLACAPFILWLVYGAWREHQKRQRRLAQIRRLQAALTPEMIAQMREALDAIQREMRDSVIPQMLKFSTDLQERLGRIRPIESTVISDRSGKPVVLPASNRR